MAKISEGQKPDLTPAQLVASLVAGVPIISNLAAAFGVFAPSPEQQDALTNSINWAVPFAGLLLGADAGLRTARNAAAAKTQAAALDSEAKPPDVAHGGPPHDEAGEDLEAAGVPDEELPSDDEELGAPPPEDLDTLDEDDKPSAVQPSQDE